MATEKTKTARYISKYRNLTIAVKSSYYKVVEDKRVLVEGKRVVFTDGFFETQDEALMQELEQRADFGTAFVRIPDNKSVDQMRDAMKTISEKDRIIAEQAAEIERLKLGKDETGGDADTGSGTEDDLDTMNRAGLVQVAETLGLPPESYKVGTKNDAIKAAIRAKRAEVAADGGTGTFDE